MNRFVEKANSQNQSREENLFCCSGLLYSIATNDMAKLNPVLKLLGVDDAMSSYICLSSREGIQPTGNIKRYGEVKELFMKEVAVSPCHSQQLQLLWMAIWIVLLLVLTM